MFTCHTCKRNKSTSGKLWWIQYATWDDYVAHNAQHHPLDFVNGVPFWMLEEKIVRDDYFWVARSIQDKAWLKYIGWKA